MMFIAQRAKSLLAGTKANFMSLSAGIRSNAQLLFLVVPARLLFELTLGV
jgi:hypothetical protein